MNDHSNNAVDIQGKDLKGYSADHLFPHFHHPSHPHFFNPPVLDNLGEMIFLTKSFSNVELDSIAKYGCDEQVNY